MAPAPPRPDVCSRKNLRTAYEQAQEALRGKQQRINEMARLTREQSRCFRAELNEALMGPTVSEGRSWAIRVLDWTFARRTAVRRADACCDVCNPELVIRLRASAYAPVTAAMEISP